MDQQNHTDATSGADASQDDFDSSGTRLKARRYVAADGAKQFLGWRDTQRNENCNFGDSADGVTRCLPTDVIFSTHQAGYYGYDSSCTNPYVLVSDCTANHDKRYVAEVSTSCGVLSGQIIRPIVSMQPANTTLQTYAPDLNGACMPFQNWAASAGSNWAVVGAPVAANEFVQASVVVDP